MPKRITSFVNFIAIVALVFLTISCKTSSQPGSTFDPSATDSKVTQDNSVQMTLDDYDNTGIQVRNQGNGTLTLPLPILFKDNRTPTLHLEKMIDPWGKKIGLDDYLIDDGLQEGDIIFSPFDGFINIETRAGVPASYIQVWDGEYEISLPVGGFSIYDATTLKLFIDPEQATIKINDMFLGIPVKKGQPIAEVIVPDEGKSVPPIEIVGLFIEETTFNLAVSGGKVILLK